MQPLKLKLLKVYIPIINHLQFSNPFCSIIHVLVQKVLSPKTIAKEDAVVILQLNKTIIIKHFPYFFLN